MEENTPRCRLCGFQLKSESGCDVCTPVKRVLVWPVLDLAESEVSAQSVISSTLRALKRRLTKIEREQRSEGDSYDGRLTRDLGTISRALKELAAEQRKLEDREEDRYNSLGIEGRMRLFITEFFSKLPEDFQVKLLQGMRDTYNKQNASLLPEGNEQT
jgi:hypothetical protein